MRYYPQVVKGSSPNLKFFGKGKKRMKKQAGFWQEFKKGWKAITHPPSEFEKFQQRMQDVMAKGGGQMRQQQAKYGTNQAFAEKDVLRQRGYK